ncbi:MAG: trehalose-6-phosphate synthase, partial [Acidimicrobiia bacterium]
MGDMVQNRPLIAFANRLPVVRGRGGWRKADGGLVAALHPVVESKSGTWVGWDGGAGDPPRKLDNLN